MDYFLGKCKLLKLLEGMEKVDNPVADEEIEKIIKDISFKRARCFTEL